jgi:hypothetical protein
MVIALAILVGACGDDGAKYPVEQLQDPSTCMQCHPTHYTQWSGSMHAYASDDPVFVAMNKRGQRDTNGALGDFCIKCHAPMAVELGLASGSNFDPSTLPAAAKGVTCYFCHNVDQVAEDHNNGLVLALDQTMRGGAKNPASSPAHHSKYDENMASSTNNSRMCGSCHDVTTTADVHLERTYAEWQTTVFAHDDPQNLLPLTCSGCHMFSSTGQIAEGPDLDVGTRNYGVHEHTFQAIDQALIPWPQMAEQAALIQRDLDPAVKIVGLRPLGSLQPMGGICVNPTNITVRIDTFSVGHMFPSGAAQDRRTWLEVVAYDASNNVVFSSGVVPDDKDPEETNDDYVKCQNGPMGCSGFWDRTYTADDQQAHFFWDVARVDSKLLRPQITFDKNDPAYDHSTTVQYNNILTSSIDRVEARLRIRPLPLSMLRELVASGDLDASFLTKVPTLGSLGGTSTWTKATAGMGQAIGTGCNPQ